MTRCVNAQPQTENEQQTEQIQPITTECYLVENPEGVREVSKMTHGLVTQGRAKQVWIRRKGSTNVEPQAETIEQAEQIQEVATERYLPVNIKQPPDLIRFF